MTPMTPKHWEAIRDKVADAAAEALGLEDDLVVSEIRTAETQEEALGRMAAIRDDSAEAIRIIRSFKQGPKDWTPGKKRWR